MLKLDITLDYTPERRDSYLKNGVSYDRVREGFNARVITHDGTIWPHAREKMINGDSILARLVEDCSWFIARKFPHPITRAEFIALGWNEAQLEPFLPQAIHVSLEATGVDFKYVR
jgi:hypothetical protein